jgi:hypothetical protein
MVTSIDTAVIFAFGLVMAGVVALAVFQARELAERQAKVEAAERDIFAPRRVAR